MDKPLLNLLEEEKSLLLDIRHAKEQVKKYKELAEKYSASAKQLGTENFDKIRKEEREKITNEYVQMTSEHIQQVKEFEDKLLEVRKEIKQYFSFLPDRL